MPELLPSEVLRGARIAISVSESPDLDRLGLLEIHCRLALGVDDGAWLPPLADAPSPDPRWEDGRNRLVAHAARPDWTGLKNGLSDDENRRLAASHRPSDIATLVSLGLGRLRNAGGA